MWLRELISLRWQLQLNRDQSSFNCASLFISNVSRGETEKPNWTSRRLGSTLFKRPVAVRSSSVEAAPVLTDGVKQQLLVPCSRLRLRLLLLIHSFIPEVYSVPLPPVSRRRLVCVASSAPEIFGLLLPPRGGKTVSFNHVVSFSGFMLTELMLPVSLSHVRSCRGASFSV